MGNCKGSIAKHFLISSELPRLRKTRKHSLHIFSRRGEEGNAEDVPFLVEGRVDAESASASPPGEGHPSSVWQAAGACGEAGLLPGVPGLKSAQGSGQLQRVLDN